MFSFHISFRFDKITTKSWVKVLCIVCIWFFRVNMKKESEYLHNLWICKHSDFNRFQFDSNENLSVFLNQLKMLYNFSSSSRTRWPLSKFIIDTIMLWTRHMEMRANSSCRKCLNFRFGGRYKSTSCRLSQFTLVFLSTSIIPSETRDFHKRKDKSERSMKKTFRTSVRFYWYFHSIFGLHPVASTLHYEFAFSEQNKWMKKKNEK